MHHPISLLLGLLLWLASRDSPIKPDSDAAVVRAVQTSLITGNASQLSACFARSLELVIDTEQVDFPSLSPSHAELILRSFFRKYPPHGFRFVYRGASEHLHYRTGTYITDGQAFTVYVLMGRNASHQYVINSLHIRRQ